MRTRWFEAHLGSRYFPVRNWVNQSLLCKLWAHRFYKNMILRDLGFVGLLLAVRSHWPRVEITLFSFGEGGWLVTAPGATGKKKNSFRHVLKQLRDRGRRKMRTPGLLLISYWLRKKKGAGLRSSRRWTEVWSEMWAEGDKKKRSGNCANQMWSEIQIQTVG